MTVRPNFLLLLLCFSVISSAVVSAEKPVVELARPGHSTPWVSGYNGERVSVVPLSGIPMLDGVLFRTDFYEIDPDVVENGYFYLYYVRGRRHDYLVESTVQLYRLLGELRSLEKLAKYDPAGEYFTGMRQELSKTGRARAKSKVDAREKMERAKPGAGKAAPKPGHGYGFLYKRVPPIGVSGKGEDRGKLGAGTLGDECRKIAYAYGLDVYTDNPEVREALLSVANKRILIPEAKELEPLELGGKLVRNDRIEEEIRDLGPESVRIVVGAELSETFGMAWSDPGTVLGRFMLNPNYTPRQLLYIGEGLKDMAAVEGVDKILASLGLVDSPELADFAYVYFRLYHVLHMKAMRLVRFVELENTGGAIGENGVFYFIFPGDVLSEWSLSRREMDEVLNEVAAHGAKKLKVLALGVVAPEIQTYLRGMGVTVIQNILKDPRFFDNEY